MLRIINKEYILVNAAPKKDAGEFEQYTTDSMRYAVVATGLIAKERYGDEALMGKNLVFLNNEKNLPVIEGTEELIFVHVDNVIGLRED